MDLQQVLKAHFRGKSMKTYYDEILETIQNHIKMKEYDEAKALIYTELKMPYIPVDFEKELKDCLCDIKEASGVNQQVDFNIEDLEKYLFDEDELQLVAVSKLNTMNLRQYTEIIDRYLRSNPYPSAAALLIDSCIEQKLDESFIYIKNQVEYEFTPSCCLRPIESGGFSEAQSYLSEWFENHDPSFYEFTIQHLIQECFTYLPLSYDKEDGYQLALLVVRFVLGLMGRESEWESLEHTLVEREDLTNYRLLS